MARQYIKIFLDWMEATAELTHEEKGRLIDAIVSHAQGKTPELVGNERFIFPPFRLQIDRDIVAYDEISEKRRAAGAKGGKQKQANLAKASKCKQGQDQDQDHDQDHDQEVPVEYAAAAGDDRPDFNTVEVYAANNLTAMSGKNMEDFVAFKDIMSEDLMRHAIDEACAQGKRTWAYVRAILMRYEQDGIKTVGDAKATAKKTATTEANWGDL